MSCKIYNWSLYTHTEFDMSSPIRKSISPNIPSFRSLFIWQRFSICRWFTTENSYFGSSPHADCDSDVSNSHNSRCVERRSTSAHFFHRDCEVKNWNKFDYLCFHTSTHRDFQASHVWDIFRVNLCGPGCRFRPRSLRDRRWLGRAVYWVLINA